MKQIKTMAESKCFDGNQYVLSHNSISCACEMTFGLYLPEAPSSTKLPLIWFLSGLTCTHENAMVKSGIQKWASEKKVAIVFPDTSPRGDEVSDDSSFDLGQGAGFYVNSLRSPWKKNYQMWSYILEELPELLFKSFEIDQEKQSIMGHSMGGLGALNMAFRNPETFKAVSAFAPIANPTAGIWGRKQFEAYLGPDEKCWEEYDPSILLSKKGYVGKILIDQGSKDNFFDNLSPKSLEKLVSATNEDNLFRYQEGYDHSYFFVSTFMQEHIFWHEKQLRG